MISFFKRNNVNSNQLYSEVDTIFDELTTCLSDEQPDFKKVIDKLNSVLKKSNSFSRDLMANATIKFSIAKAESLKMIIEGYQQDHSKIMPDRLKEVCEEYRVSPTEATLTKVQTAFRETVGFIFHNHINTSYLKDLKMFLELDQRPIEPLRTWVATSAQCQELCAFKYDWKET